jgi:hypothetical protein
MVPYSRSPSRGAPNPSPSLSPVTTLAPATTSSLSLSLSLQSIVLLLVTRRTTSLALQAVQGLAMGGYIR